MQTLNRMFLGQYLRVFGLAAGGMLSLMLLFDYFDLAREASARSPAPGALLRYLAWSAPKYAVYAVPLAVLVSTLVVLGIAGRNRELVAIRSLGGSLRRATRIFVLLGLFWSVFSFFLSEVLVPLASHHADRVREVEILGRTPKTAFSGGRLWTRLDSGAILSAAALSGNRMLGVSVFEFDRGLRRRIEAAEARFDGGGWRLEEVRIYRFDGKGVRVRRRGEYLLPSLESPEELGRARVDPEEMPFDELRRYARNLERAGFPADKYRVSLHGKLAQPLVCLAMAVLGSALSIRRSRGGALLAMAYAVALVVLYWAVQMMLISLGYSGRLSPAPAAWGAPLLFLGLGVWLFVRAEG